MYFHNLDIPIKIDKIERPISEFEIGMFPGQKSCKVLF